MNEYDLHDRQKFQAAKPFPHLVVDNYCDEKLVNHALDALPAKHDPLWKRYQKNKRGLRDIEKLAGPVQRMAAVMTSKNQAAWLSRVTGISGLIPDTTYAGAGIHSVGSGGSLGVHVDFNEIKKIKGKIEAPLYRRLNTFLYLNDEWEPEWGGDLGLYGPPKPGGKPGLLYKSIAPKYNRFVAFETVKDSWHGHPRPLECPVDRSRLSFAVYWYTLERPPWFTKKHSTVYVK
jgi:Rps23 Pro-64 3,4-dihydroxylase Tpa1-like proline 4-hydroxylase